MEHKINGVLTEYTQRATTEDAKHAPGSGPWRGLSETCTDANLMCGESSGAIDPQRTEQYQEPDANAGCIQCKH